MLVQHVISYHLFPVVCFAVLVETGLWVLYAVCRATIASQSQILKILNIYNIPFHFQTQSYEQISKNYLRGSLRRKLEIKKKMQIWWKLVCVISLTGSSKFERSIHWFDFMLTLCKDLLHFQNKLYNGTFPISSRNLDTLKQ